MVFFKPKPNLPDGEKARMEYHFQQLAECVGFERFRLPVLSQSTLLGLLDSKRSPKDIIRFLGDHLSHDASEIQFELIHKPQAASCSGGG